MSKTRTEDSAGHRNDQQGVDLRASPLGGGLSMPSSLDTCRVGGASSSRDALFIRALSFASKGALASFAAPLLSLSVGDSGYDC